MKKTLLALLALSLSAIAYAGEGCGGGCGKDKPVEKPAAPEAPKA